MIHTISFVICDVCYVQGPIAKPTGVGPERLAYERGWLNRLEKIEDEPVYRHYCPSCKRSIPTTPSYTDNKYGWSLGNISS